LEGSASTATGGTHHEPGLIPAGFVELSKVGSPSVNDRGNKSERGGALQIRPPKKENHMNRAEKAALAEAITQREAERTIAELLSRDPNEQPAAQVAARLLATGAMSQLTKFATAERERRTHPADLLFALAKIHASLLGVLVRLTAKSEEDQPAVINALVELTRVTMEDVCGEAGDKGEVIASKIIEEAGL
jgi:hypothetical protein